MRTTFNMFRSAISCDVVENELSIFLFFLLKEKRHIGVGLPRFTEQGKKLIEPRLGPVAVEQVNY